MSNQPSDASQIQKPGHLASAPVGIQKPGHITRAYAHAVQSQAQLVQSHEELVLALQEEHDVTRPTHAGPPTGGDGSKPAPPSIQEAIQDVTASAQTLARAVTVLQQLLISRPLG